MPEKTDVIERRHALRMRLTVQRLIKEVKHAQGSLDISFDEVMEAVWKTVRRKDDVNED